MPMQMDLPFHHVKQQQLKSGTVIPIVTLLYGATSNSEKPHFMLVYLILVTTPGKLMSSNIIIPILQKRKTGT